MDLLGEIKQAKSCSWGKGSFSTDKTSPRYCQLPQRPIESITWKYHEMRSCKLQCVLHLSRRQIWDEGRSKTASVIVKLVQQHLKGLNIFHIFHFVTEKAFQDFCQQDFYGWEHRSRQNLIKYYYLVFYYTVNIFILFENWIRWGKLKPVVPRNEQYHFRKTPMLSNTSQETPARVELNCLWVRILTIKSDWKNRSTQNFAHPLKQNPAGPAHIQSLRSLQGWS